MEALCKLAECSRKGEKECLLETLFSLFKNKNDQVVFI